MERIAQDVWLLVCTGLVFFMQPGFLCLEAGAVRRRNAVNVAMKNFVVELSSTIAFFAIGYSIMFGTSLNGWLGMPSPMLAGVQDRELFQFLFQAVFCGTAATIVSGAVAERVRFLPFILQSAVLCAVLYPLFGHWVWGGGWLAQLGFKDFAGGSVVHLMGASISLAGVLIVGPRIGRFGPDGKPKDIPASDLVISSLGTFILFFGWIGFNGGSAPFGDHTPLIVTNTIIAGCFGGLAAMLSSWAMRGVADITLILNGTLGGLVAITACADVVPLQVAPVVGILAGLTVHGVTVLIERWRLDDAVGVLPVHGACGILGLLLTPVFATPAALAAHITTTGRNVDRLSWLGVQAVGIAACIVVGFVGGWIVWKVVGKITRLRVSPEGEAVGMNYSEHRLPDAVAEMHMALQGGSMNAIDLDRVRGSEFEPIARAINKIVADLKVREERSKQERSDVESTGNRILEVVRAARGRQDASLRTIDDVGQKLANLVDFTRSQAGNIGPSASALAVAGDMVEQMRKVLSSVSQDQGHLGELWARMEDVSNRLAQIVRNMEGSVQRV